MLSQVASLHKIKAIKQKENQLDKDIVKHSNIPIYHQVEL